MPKTASRRRAKLPPLTPAGQAVMTYVINSLALDEFPDCCSLEDVAKHLGKDPAHFKTTVRKLAEQGYLDVQGETLEMLYPTVEALLARDPSLSREAARRLLAKAKKK